MPHRGVLALYRELLALRRSEPALRRRCREGMTVSAAGDRGLTLRREAAGGGAILLIVNLGEGLDLRLDDRPETRPPEGRAWSLVLGTEAGEYGGDGTCRLTAAGAAELRSAGALVLRA